MNKDVQVLRESIKVITQVLTESNIKVTQSGVDAFVKADPKTKRPILINLPYLPDDASEELIYAIQGYLDHEVAHALFSDFEIPMKARQLGCQSLHNIIEDTFVERKMAQKFRGSAYNLSNVSSFYINKYIAGVLERNDEDEIKAVLTVTAIRAFAGQQTFVDFMKDHWSKIPDFKKVLESFSDDLQKVNSSEDGLEVAIKIKKAFEKPTPPPPPSEPEKKEEEQEESDSSGDSGKSDKTPPEKPEKSKGDEKSDDTESGDEETDEDQEGSADASDSEEGENEESDGEKENELSESEEEEEGDFDSDIENDNQEADGDTDEEEDDGSDSEEEDDSELSDEKVEEKYSDDIDDKGSTDFEPTSIDIDSMIANSKAEEGLSKELSKEIVHVAKTSNYILFSDEGDKIEPLDKGIWASTEQAAAFEDEVTHLTGPIQKDLERAIIAQSKSVWENGRRSGRLHSASLSRLATNDTRVFRKRIDSESKDVAVSLVIDCSGSMRSQNKIKIAAQAAMTFSSVLGKLGIAHEVIGYTTLDINHSDAVRINEASSRHGIVYARAEWLHIPIFKSFAEPVSIDVKRKIAAAPLNLSLGSNIDGESIQIAAKRLMGRKEKGKIMMVLSDGQPAGWGGGDFRGHLRKSVEEISKAGVKTIGIGVMTEAVKDFYPRNVIVNKIGDLPTVVTNELKAMLLQP